MSLPLIISGHGFYGYQWFSRSEGDPFSLAARQELTPVQNFGCYIYCTQSIGHNPGVSLPLNISSHGFHDYPWLSRLEGGQFSLAARQELTLVLGYILCPSQKAIILVCHYLRLIQVMDSMFIHGSPGQREVLSLQLL